MNDAKKPSPAKGLRVIEVLGFEKKTELALPLLLAPVAAGFPSPADDYIGVTSPNGKNSTLRIPQGAQTALGDLFAEAPNVIPREVEVLPAQRG